MNCRYLSENKNCKNIHNKTKNCKFKDTEEFNNCYYSPCSNYFEQFKNK